MGIMDGTDADFMEACDRRDKQPSAASAGSSPCDRINAMVAEAKAMKDDGYYLWLLCITAAEHLGKNMLSAVIIGCATEVTKR